MAKRWSYSAGSYGRTATVYERGAGGVLYLRFPSTTGTGYVIKSLGHRDRTHAEEQAEETAKRLRAGEGPEPEGRPTLKRIFALYLKHRSPHKGEWARRDDARRRGLFEAYYGPDADPWSITERQWEAFIAARLAGVVDSRGRRVPEKERRPVRNRSVEADLRWLNAAFNWATRHRPGGARRFLLDANPVKGFAIPKEKNPRRGVATQERFERTLARAGEVHPFLPVMLVLANETGRRIGAIRQLRHGDLRLGEGRHGMIDWPAETDKTGHRWERVPITAGAREALEAHLRAHPGIGDAYLFPAPRGEGPVAKDLASAWLRKAEKRAGVPDLPGRLWHAYRAKFATEMIDQPVQLTAKLGGWKTPRVITDIYQQPQGTQLEAALERRKVLRQA